MMVEGGPCVRVRVRACAHHYLLIRTLTSLAPVNGQTPILYSPLMMLDWTPHKSTGNAISKCFSGFHAKSHMSVTTLLSLKVKS